MSSGLIGKKVGMTNIFDDNGNNFAVTVIEVEPCVITQIKTLENDGYEAVQLASFDRKEASTPKPQVEHFKKAGTSPKKYVVEIRDFIPEEKELGDEITVSDIFAVGTNVDVAGITKGKGFAGVMKRHNFAGVGGQTHGQKDRERHSGSIGHAAKPARVFKSLKMPGRAGNKRTTVQNLTIARIFEESNLMMVTGSIPGANGGMVEIYNR